MPFGYPPHFFCLRPWLDRLEFPASFSISLYISNVSANKVQPRAIRVKI